MATKKTPAKKNNVKKSAPKKAAAKRSAPKKTTQPKAKDETDEVTAPPKTAASVANENCKCMQRKSKYYCYHRIQGRWVQASGIGYPSKKMCEENCCG